jgi:hypothetical protein
MMTARKNPSSGVECCDKEGNSPEMLTFYPTHRMMKQYYYQSDNNFLHGSVAQEIIHHLHLLK